MRTWASRPRRGVLCCPPPTTKETQQIIYNGIYESGIFCPNWSRCHTMEQSMLELMSAFECGPDTCRDGLDHLHPQFKNPLRSTHTAVCKAENKRKDQYWSFTLAWPRHLSCVSGPALDVAATPFQGIFEIFEAGFWIGTELLSNPNTEPERLQHFHTHIRILLCFPVRLVLRRKGIFK